MTLELPRDDNPWISGEYLYGDTIRISPDFCSPHFLPTVHSDTADAQAPQGFPGCLVLTQDQPVAAHIVDVKPGSPPSSLPRTQVPSAGTLSTRRKTEPGGHRGRSTGRGGSGGVDRVRVLVSTEEENGAE